MVGVPYLVGISRSFSRFAMPTKQDPALSFEVSIWDACIEGSFTTYYIRHSWVTIAKYMGISTEIISEGLGHSSIKATEIYLKDFNDLILDESNEMLFV